MSGGSAKISRVVAGVLMTLFVVATAASPASAASWPTGCTYAKYTAKIPTTTQSFDGTKAKCTGGGGYYKAVVICRSAYTYEDGVYEAYDWRRPGTESIRLCPTSTVYRSSGILSKAG
jgi:hypothetical protein